MPRKAMSGDRVGEDTSDRGEKRAWMLSRAGVIGVGTGMEKWERTPGKGKVV